MGDYGTLDILWDFTVVLGMMFITDLKTYGLDYEL